MITYKQLSLADIFFRLPK